MPNANDMDLVREYATRNSEPALNRIVHKPEKAGRRKSGERCHWHWFRHRKSW